MFSYPPREKLHLEAKMFELSWPVLREKGVHAKLIHGLWHCDVPTFFHVPVQRWPLTMSASFVNISKTKQIDAPKIQKPTVTHDSHNLIASPITVVIRLLISIYIAQGQALLAPWLPAPFFFIEIQKMKRIKKYINWKGGWGLEKDKRNPSLAVY